MNTTSTIAMMNDKATSVIIFRVTGKLTLGGNIRLFREQVGDLLEAGLNNILVDVANVTDMDSSGIGELLMARETVSITGGEIKLLNVGKRARDILHGMILSAVFETFEDESSAILSYSLCKPPDPTVAERAEKKRRVPYD